MKKYLSVGMYGMHRDKTVDNENVQFGLAQGLSYLPEHNNEIIVKFHKSVNIEINEEGTILKLNLQEAKMLSNVINNLANHLEQKVILSKQGFLKEEAYMDEDNENNQTF